MSNENAATKTLHAHVTAYKGRIVMELLATKSIAGEVATSLDSPSSFGQVIMNTKEHLGVSKEALELLKTVKRGNDSLGGIDWFKTSDGNHAFSWMGGPYQITTPQDADASRSYVVSDHFVEIENTVPEGARHHIDGSDGGEKE